MFKASSAAEEHLDQRDGRIEATFWKHLITKQVPPLKRKSEKVLMNHLVSVPDKRHDILGGELVGGQ